MYTGVTTLNQFFNHYIEKLTFYQNCTKTSIKNNLNAQKLLFEIRTILTQISHGNPCNVKNTHCIGSKNNSRALINCASARYERGGGGVQIVLFGGGREREKRHWVRLFRRLETGYPPLPSYQGQTRLFKGLRIGWMVHTPIGISHFLVFLLRIFAFFAFNFAD